MKYGWKPDLPDARDLIYRSAIGKVIPDHADLRSKCSAVEDQGALGSCTGNAIAGALEFLDRANGKPVDISRLFIYYQERVLEGTVRQDAGAAIRDGIKACAKVGAPIESTWPYNVAKFARKPPKAAYADAATRKIVSYHRVTGLQDMLACLADGYPVVFGFSVYDSFESAEVAKTGMMPMPTANERLLGGHAVLAVGYSQPDQRMIVRNSWGSSWGQKGYFTMPYGVIQNRNMSDDFWTIRR